MKKDRAYRVVRGQKYYIITFNLHHELFDKLIEEMEERGVTWKEFLHEAIEEKLGG